jgi:hypothetical protein
VSAIGLRHRFDHPLAWCGSSRRSRHRQVAPRCLETLQGFKVERRGPLPIVRACLLDARRLALRRVERLLCAASPGAGGRDPAGAHAPVRPSP